MNSASKVGEIFIAAGEAFKKLADLTMQLHPAAGPSDGCSSSQAASVPKATAAEAGPRPKAGDLALGQSADITLARLNALRCDDDPEQAPRRFYDFLDRPHPHPDST